jgi:hypothetical protein
MRTHKSKIIYRKNYHGWKLEEAISDVEMLISRARMSNEPIYTEFITGNGKIKNTLLKILKEYGINGQEQLGNSGVIVSNLE